MQVVNRISDHHAACVDGGVVVFRVRAVMVVCALGEQERDRSEQKCPHKERPKCFKCESLVERLFTEPEYDDRKDTCGDCDKVMETGREPLTEHLPGEYHTGERGEHDR